MADDIWFSRCLPVLEALAEAEEDAHDPARAAREAWDERGLPDHLYMRTLGDLYEAGFVRADTLQAAFEEGLEVFVHGLTPKGRQAVGQWPGGRGAAELLIQVVIGLESTETDPVQKSRAAKVREAILAAGTDLAAKTMGEIYAHSAGLP